jgi:hypothetical protein
MPRSRLPRTAQSALKRAIACEIHFAKESPAVQRRYFDALIALLTGEGAASVSLTELLSAGMTVYGHKPS